jgi:hypothetical protein
MTSHYIKILYFYLLLFSNYIYILDPAPPSFSNSNPTKLEQLKKSLAKLTTLGVTIAVPLTPLKFPY